MYRFVDHDIMLDFCRNLLTRAFLSFLQYPVGTPEVPLATPESSGITTLASPTASAQVGYKRTAFIGSCKHHIWQAIRASSAAPYYLDDFSDGIPFCINFLYFSFVLAISCLLFLYLFVAFNIP